MQRLSEYAATRYPSDPELIAGIIDLEDFVTAAWRDLAQEPEDEDDASL